MYRIEKTNYGFKMVFGDFITADEMAAWYHEAERQLQAARAPFGVLVDMRELKPLKADAQTHMEAGQKLFKEKGMQRSAVVLKDLVTTMQFRRIAKQTGIYEWERYINAQEHPDWEKSAVAWAQHGQDPDK